MQSRERRRRIGCQRTAGNIYAATWPNPCCSDKRRGRRNARARDAACARRRKINTAGLVDPWSAQSRRSSVCKRITFSPGAVIWRKTMHRVQQPRRRRSTGGGLRCFRACRHSAARENRSATRRRILSVWPVCILAEHARGASNLGRDCRQCAHGNLWCARGHYAWYRAGSTYSAPPVRGARPWSVGVVRAKRDQVRPLGCPPARSKLWFWRDCDPLCNPITRSWIDWASHRTPRRLLSSW